MPSTIERSAPAESASLAEVMTTPLTSASAEVCFTISSSSLIEVSSSTFIERPGMSQVTSAMPSALVSTLKFLKAMWCSLDANCQGRRGGRLQISGLAEGVTHHVTAQEVVGYASLTHPTAT